MTLAPDDPRHGTSNGYKNLGCRCDFCRKAAADANRAYNHRTGRHRPLAIYLAEQEPWKHGTPNGYTYHACRCASCRDAYTAYCRTRKIGGYTVRVCPICGGEMRAVAQLCRSCFKAAREPAHGTESRYTQRGCRCDECKRASREARARRRAKVAA